ncbi:TPA: hypothetical protein ACNR56_004771, partial [Escherichia coli]
HYILAEQKMTHKELSLNLFFSLFASLISESPSTAKLSIFSVRGNSNPADSINNMLSLTLTFSASRA